MRAVHAATKVSVLARIASNLALSQFFIKFLNTLLHMLDFFLYKDAEHVRVRVIKRSKIG